MSVNQEFNNNRFRFKMPTNQIATGNLNPIWSVGSIQSINIESSTPSDNDMLYYDDASKLWKSGSLSSIISPITSDSATAFTVENTSNAEIFNIDATIPEVTIAGGIDTDFEIMRNAGTQTAIKYIQSNNSLHIYSSNGATYMQFDGINKIQSYNYNALDAQSATMRFIGSGGSQNKIYSQTSNFVLEPSSLLQVLGGSLQHFAVSTNSDFVQVGANGHDVDFNVVNTAGSTIFSIDTSASSVTSSGTYIAGITTSSGPGAVAITGQIHEITTTGTGDALTLADGTAGQILKIIYVAEGAGADTAILTPTTFASGTTITFNNIGEGVDLVYSSTGGWYVVGVNGAVVA